MISVGNIAVGGTGKTPFAVSLCRLLAERFPNFDRPGSIAVLSRGYGRRSTGLYEVQSDSDWSQCGDEPLLIKRLLPQASVIVHASRFTAGGFALANSPARVCVLDDGFQHYGLARDLDLVLIPGEHPLGNGRLLPAGPLREPPGGLRRAHAIVSVGTVHESSRSLATHLGLPLICAHAELERTPDLLRLHGQPCVAMTGIANPGRMTASLAAEGLSLHGHVRFPDHHAFTSEDLEKVVRLAEQSKAVAVVTSEKDSVRIPRWPFDLPLVIAKMQMIIDDSDIVVDLLTKHVGMG